MIRVLANREQELIANVLSQLARHKTVLNLFVVLVFSGLVLLAPRASALHVHQEPEGTAHTQAGSPSAAGAFARSLVVPGWGHYYSGGEHGRTGRWFLASEAVLVVSLFTLSGHAAVLDQNAQTMARAYAGVDVSLHGRAFELAVGNHGSRAAYEDALERSRSWDLLDRFPNEPSYNWEWRAEEDRLAYRDMRSRRDHVRQQMPVIGALMVANRLVSAIGAYNRARSGRLSGMQSVLEPGLLTPDGYGSVQLRLRFDF